MDRDIKIIYYIEYSGSSDYKNINNWIIETNHISEKGYENTPLGLIRKYWKGNES